MKAVAVIPGQTDSVRIVNVDKPEISAGEVLVEVIRVGVDGTDIEINEGLYGEAPEGDAFLIIGHESLGIVREVGDGISNFKKGDYVVATVRRPDDCLNCRAGEYDMCLTGDYKERGIKGLHGFMSEFYKESHEFLVKVPEKISELGVLLEPLSIVEKAVSQAYKIQERLEWQPKTALVTGAGAIGILACLVLRNMALDVYVVARSSAEGNPKADLIRECGATYISSSGQPISSLKLGNIDLLVEATGSSAVVFDAIKVLGTNGVAALTSITATEDVHEVCAACINLDMVLNNKVVFGSVNANRRHFEMGLVHLPDFERKWPGLLGKIITRRVPFRQFREALERRKGDIKIVIEVQM
ncbi:MAG: glucose 1-dehydrogenase [Candidatus Hydrothermarchaeales archaeon]